MTSKSVVRIQIDEHTKIDGSKQAMALTRDFRERTGSRAIPLSPIRCCAKGSTPCWPAMSTPARRSCDYIKATVGFEKLGEATGTPAKSLIRMLGPRGNPQARNLFGIVGYLQKLAGVELHVAPGPGQRRRPPIRERPRARSFRYGGAIISESGGGFFRNQHISYYLHELNIDMASTYIF
jgi:hypothetical protein